MQLSWDATSVRKVDARRLHRRAVSPRGTLFLTLIKSLNELIAAIHFIKDRRPSSIASLCAILTLKSYRAEL
jgi:hypothetical protein